MSAGAPSTTFSSAQVIGTPGQQPRPAPTGASTRLPDAPTRRLRVLLTGATGYIASQLLPTLQTRYDMVLTDARGARRDGTSIPGVHVLDFQSVSDDALRPLFAGCDAVIHLGYHKPTGPVTVGTQLAYEDERVNVDMAERVYRLSHEVGVNRVVMASSNHAADWYEPLIHARTLDQVTPGDLPRSDNYYGWSKIAYEALGFTYATGAPGRRLEVVQVRIGAPRQIEEAHFVGNPVGFKRDLGAWISPRDLTQLIVRSVETLDIRNGDGVPFLIVNGVSNNTRGFWSIANARVTIGYAPEDDSEVFYADAIRHILLDHGDRGRVGTEPTGH
ncbi:MAG: NAD(P)-dependent oxidoreductase [Proteobacteria bacterium]|nr:NAD(P)-dependent oxidoreductase [Pseudomonadota bacterium]